MKRRTYVRQAFRPLSIVSLCFLLFAVSCKKDSEPDIQPDATPVLTSFSIASETSEALIDNNSKTITVFIGDLFNWQNLTVTFKISNSGQLMHENQALVSGTSTLDFSKSGELMLKASDGKTTNWSIITNSLLESYGLGKKLNGANSLNKTYNYYFDQGGTGPHQYINCGPTVTTMALKWSDPSFSKSPQDARTAILPAGGWWYTNHIESYLTSHGVKMAYSTLGTTLTNAQYADKLKNIIDKGYAVILCLDMFFVQQETDASQRINKFYATDAKEWGHFLLIKGYKIVDGEVWLETYDPYSLDQKYAGNEQLKGKNRYYDAAELKKATDTWWPYAIAVAPKGSSVSGISALTSSKQQAIIHQKGGLFITKN